MNKVQEIRKLKREIYSEYGFYYYVPMAESFTVQIPVTISCSYKKCLFCDLNQNMKFRELSIDEIKSNIEKLKIIHDNSPSRSPKKFLLAGGNPFFINTEKLLKISELIHLNFPECEYISCFSRADDILKKTDSELRELKNSGYDRICIGIESGSDRVLKFQNKGVGRDENLKSMKALDEAGIKYSAYIMLGLGGRDFSDEHIEETSSLLNFSNPFELTVVTLVLFKGAKLIEKVRNHEFKRMNTLETLKEGRDLLSRLEINTVWNATHKTNLFPVKGRIPEHKNLLLSRINSVIEEISKSDLKQYELRRWLNWGSE